MLDRVDRLPQRVLVVVLRVCVVGGLLAAATLMLFYVTAIIAYDSGRKQWDTQTFALLFGGCGYVIAQLAGAGRTAAVEWGFVASAFAAGYASLTKPGTELLLVALAAAVILGLMSLYYRKLAPRLEGTKPEFVEPLPPPVTAPDARAMLEATEKRVRQATARRLWLVAVLGGAAGALIARIADRRR